MLFFSPTFGRTKWSLDASKWKWRWNECIRMPRPNGKRNCMCKNENDKMYGVFPRKWISKRHKNKRIIDKNETFKQKKWSQNQRGKGIGDNAKQDTCIKITHQKRRIKKTKNISFAYSTVVLWVFSFVSSFAFSHSLFDTNASMFLHESKETNTFVVRNGELHEHKNVKNNM